jgi:hypothetical protein
LLQAKDHRRLGNEKQKITRKGDETDAWNSILYEAVF